MLRHNLHLIGLRDALVYVMKETVRIQMKWILDSCAFLYSEYRDLVSSLHKVRNYVTFVRYKENVRKTNTEQRASCGAASDFRSRDVRAIESQPDLKLTGLRFLVALVNTFRQIPG
jgi:hypothetical protein